MQVVQEEPQAFISQLIPGETERQKDKAVNPNSSGNATLRSFKGKRCNFWIWIPSQPFRFSPL